MEHESKCYLVDRPIRSAEDESVQPARQTDAFRPQGWPLHFLHYIYLCMRSTSHYNLIVTYLASLGTANYSTN